VNEERWITFDCYGTLLDWQSAFRRILEPVADGRIEALVEAFHAVEPEVERELSDAPYKTILRECTTRAAQRAGVALAAPDRDALVANWHTIGAFGDTVAALEELRRQGWKLGVLTNCDDDLFDATRPALGVAPDVVITAEAVGSYKPAHGHFERFEAVTGVDRRFWVHAAVSWWHDMVPARVLGLRRVWVDREDSGHDASIVTARVPDMATLAELATELYPA
jgi:2-haloacid dehalogenase